MSCNLPFSNYTSRLRKISRSLNLLGDSYFLLQLSYNWDLNVKSNLTMPKLLTLLQPKLKFSTRHVCTDWAEIKSESHYRNRGSSFSGIVIPNSHRLTTPYVRATATTPLRPKVSSSLPAPPKPTSSPPCTQGYAAGHPLSEGTRFSPSPLPPAPPVLHWTCVEWISIRRRPLWPATDP
jgi:hypothetical protein